MNMTPGQLLDACANALDLGDLAGVQIHRASALLATSLPGQGGPDAQVRSYAETQGLGAYTPPPAPFPLLPTAPAVIWDVSAGLLPALAALLAWRYPPDHPVALLDLDSAGEAKVTQRLTLESLIDDRPPTTGEISSAVGGRSSVVFVPGLAIEQNLRDPEALHWVVARLLAPGGCPWDVRQTHQSLRGALLEEAHEVLEALDANDMAGLSEELGDLLISVFSHSEMARQAGEFAIADVLGQVTAKLIRRHPHVFGDLTVDGEGQVLQNWDQIKAAELAEKGRSRPSALDGVPAALPALAAAQKLGKKAARAGFAWPSADGAWRKLREELAELEQAAAAGDAAHAAEELGDLLFITARLGTYLDIDAEAALREANAKFRRRFGYVERGRDLAALSLDEMIALWDAAKALTPVAGATPPLPRAGEGAGG